MSAWHPHQGGDPTTALKEARHVIEHAIANQPRSLQKRIGPSEIGTECDHCLAAKLAGWKQNEGVAWLPFVGTAVHAQLDDIFTHYGARTNAMHTGGLRWVAEMRVLVGHIGDLDIHGTCDLVDFVVGMTVDWKIVGKTTLDAVKRHGPTPVYRTQAHLYAKGWNDSGRRIDHVAIAYLPRNAVSLDHAHWWTEPYDETVAVAALDRASRLYANLQALAAVGVDVRDAWITSLPRHADCRDCARYPDRPDGVADLGLRGLIPQEPLAPFPA